MDGNLMINFTIFSFFGIEVTLGKVLLFALTLGAWVMGYFLLLEKHT